MSFGCTSIPSTAENSADIARVGDQPGFLQWEDRLNGVLPDDEPSEGLSVRGTVRR